MNFFQKIFVGFLNIFYPIKIFGKENIIDGSCLIVCNHLSVVDSLYMAKCFKKHKKAFVSKKEVFENKLIAKIVSSFGAISVDREQPDVSSMLKIVKKIKLGHKIVIFPEGTRNKGKTTELLPIKGGSGVFAVKGKVPILPLSIYRRAKFLQPNYMIIGKPFYLDSFYDKHLTNEDISSISSIITESIYEQQRALYKKLAENKRA